MRRKRPLAILAGIPSERQANREEYREGCLAGTNKYAMDINGKPFGRLAIDRFKKVFDPILLLGPRAMYEPILGDDVEYMDMDNELSEKFEPLYALTEKYSGWVYLTTNDLLPRVKDLKLFVKRAEQQTGSFFTTPIHGQRLVDLGFRPSLKHKIYPLKDHEGNVQHCAFPQFWAFQSGIDIKPIVQTADEFYRNREQGIQKSWFGMLLKVLCVSGKAIFRHASVLRPLFTGMTRLYLSTKGVASPVALEKAEKTLARFQTAEGKGIFISDPIDAPSLTMDVDDDKNELPLCVKLHAEGWFE